MQNAFDVFLTLLLVLNMILGFVSGNIPSGLGWMCAVMYFFMYKNEC